MKNIIQVEGKEIKLTDKEVMFCKYYLYDFNATQAAIKAGYSEKTATSIGSQNLTKLHIKTYIDYCKKNLQEVAGIGQLKIINELKNIIEGRVTDMRESWMTLKEFEELTEEQKSTISEITVIETEGKFGLNKTVKFKVYDKLKAIDSLNKMLGYNSPEKIDHKVDVGVFDSLFVKIDGKKKSI